MNIKKKLIKKKNIYIYIYILNNYHNYKVSVAFQNVALYEIWRILINNKIILNNI